MNNHDPHSDFINNTQYPTSYATTSNRLPPSAKRTSKFPPKNKLRDSLVWVAWCSYLETHALYEVCEHADEGMKALTQAMIRCHPRHMTSKLRQCLTPIIRGWVQLEKLRNTQLAPMVKAQVKATNHLKKIIKFDKRMAPVYAKLFPKTENNPHYLGKARVLARHLQKHLQQTPKS